MTKHLRPFFYFFGAKWRVAKYYPEPTYRQLIEPFAGSAGYATYYADREVILYDRDPIICGIWDYLIRVSPAEIRRLPR